jgi:hypothetical protein
MSDLKLFTSLPITMAFSFCPTMIQQYYQSVANKTVELPDLKWQAYEHNRLQNLMIELESYFGKPLLDRVLATKVAEVLGFAHFEASQVNEWLVEHDLADIQLDPWSAPNHFGIVGKVEYARRFRLSSAPGYELPRVPDAIGFRMDISDKVIVYQKDEYTLVEIKTSQGSTWVSDYQLPDSSQGYDLMTAALYLMQNKSRNVRYNGVVLPQWQVKLPRLSLDWMKNIFAYDQFMVPWGVFQALMCGESGFNFQGARFMAGFAAEIGVLGGNDSDLFKPGPSDFVLDSPGVLQWETLPGGGYPLGVVYVPSELYAREQIYLGEGN